MGKKMSKKQAAKIEHSGWRLKLDHPRLIPLLQEVLFRLDPLGTGCVENDAYDEYDSLTLSFLTCTAARNDDILTLKAISKSFDDHFGDGNDYAVLAMFSEKAERLLKAFRIGDVVYDYTLPRPMQKTSPMTAADIEWGVMETLEEFAASVECCAFSPDESGHWVTFFEGKYYAHEGSLNDDPYTPPEGATHAFWWGK